MWNAAEEVREVGVNDVPVSAEQPFFHFNCRLLGIPPGPVVLLRHRIETAELVLRGALQQGHRARVVARATIRYRRIVAIEFATCRSGRTGGTSGSIILENARRREVTGTAG